jgi:hypothetical protein
VPDRCNIFDPDWRNVVDVWIVFGRRWLVGDRGSVVLRSLLNGLTSNEG